MRILIAPASFGPDVSAVDAARAIATGWARRAPDDELVLAPVSDGGAGFVGVLASSLDGRLETLALPDAYGDPATGQVLVAGDSAYVEAAQVVGARPGRAACDVEHASSMSVGRLVALACSLEGVGRVVIGVGPWDVATNDGGAGLLAALGATAAPPDALSTGPRGLERLTAVDLSGLARTVRGCRLVLATDDEAPLLGLLGTTSTAGGDRGIVADRISIVDRWVENLAHCAGHRPAVARGAGAGGGIGYALLVAGAERAGGFGTVAEAVGLAEQARWADVVVTGEDALGLSDRSGRTSAAVAAVAAAAARPCIALVDRLDMGTRELRTIGIESAYAIRDRAAGRPAPVSVEALSALAQRVAATWSWSPRDC